MKKEKEKPKNKMTVISINGTGNLEEALKKLAKLLVDDLIKEGKL